MVLWYHRKVNSFCTGHKFTSREQFPPCRSRPKSNGKLKRLGSQSRQRNGRSSDDCEKAKLFPVLLLGLAVVPKDQKMGAGVTTKGKAWEERTEPESDRGQNQLSENAINPNLTGIERGSVMVERRQCSSPLS